MLRRIARHELRGMGLPYSIVLLNAAEEEIGADGERLGVRIPDMEGLAASAVIARSLWPFELAGAEVRFFRRVLGYTQKQLAERMPMRAETLSRWENRAEGEDRPVGEWADKSLRMLAALELSARLPGLADHQAELAALRIQQRMENQWPEIVAERVTVRSDGRKQQEWEALPLAA